MANARRPFISKFLAPFNHSLSSLILRDQKWPTFLFGFLTIALPCGQSLIVFSACALSGSVWVGMINGFFFSLLTSPSLLFAMKAHLILGKFKSYYSALMGICASIVGTLAICRGMAELEVISHWTIETGFSGFHLVIF